MPKRIQRKRTKGWRMPANTIYVGRPTLWGNPFIHEDPKEAVNAFKTLINGGTSSFAMGPDKLQFANNAHPNTLHWSWAEWTRENLHKIAGKNLACWCPLDNPCHADVLLALANEDQS